MDRRRFLKTSGLTTAGLAMVACNNASAGGDADGGGSGSGSGGSGGGGGNTGNADCSFLSLMTPASAAIIAPGEGEVIDDEDGRYKIRAGDLGNHLSIMEMTLAPLQLLAPHTHQEYDQAVYLIEGELGFEFGGEGGQVLSGGAGSYVIKPRGLSHTFWNTSDTTTVRYIELSMNIVFEQFVDAAGEVDGLEETNEVAAAHDVEFHYDQIVRLLAEHGLTSVKGSAVTLPQLDDFPGGPPGP